MSAYHIPWQCLAAPNPSSLLTFPSRFSTRPKTSKTINNNKANGNSKYSLRCKKTTTRGITVFNSLSAQEIQQQQTDKTSSLLQPYSIKIPVGEREIVIETGRIGRQASASITVTDGETIVYTSVCLSDVPSEPSDFFPLTVNYQERFSAAGRTSGGFYKREGKTKDKEILVCRLIDRPLRPTILKGFYHEVQILSWVVSYDNIHFPDTLAIIAAGAALALSEVPISKPVAGVRVGLIGDKFLVNPTVQQMNLSKLDLIIAGTSDAILTIEGYCDFLSEESLLEAVEVGHVAIKKVCSELENLVRMHGKAKLLDTIRLPADELKVHVEKLAGNNLLQALKIKSKIPRMRAISAVEEDVLSILTDSGLVQEDPILKPEEVVSEIEDDEEEEEAVDGEVDEGDVHIKPMLKKPVTQFFDPVDVKLAFKELSSKIMRRLIVQDGRRSDGRTTEEVRPIVSQCGLLPRAHGSALFTRGETQSLAVTTLGGSSMGQRIDNLTEEEIKRFYLQYTFPPSSVGEVGRIGSPSRREVGHGMLAERALEPSLPSEEEFPYIIRVESTITESNGSSSMASVCGGCLAMLDAGVPLKCSIAGIAMGMIFDTKTSGGDGSPLILSDIIGSEDALGDMDLKVAGNEKGITAFQMDLKLTAGITLPTLAKAVLQARKGISHILGEMKKCSPPPCETMSKYAPRIYALKVDINKLYLIIGSGGRTVKNIIEESGVDSIDVQQHDGLVRIVSKDSESIEKARSRINALLLTPTVGDIFRNCEVKSVAAYGAFVEIAPGREGLLHVSEWDYTFIAKTEDVVKVGDRVDVKLIEVTERGHLRLSRRALLPKPEPSVKSSENPTLGIKGDKGIEDSITTAEETATNNAVGSVARKDDIIKKVFRVMKPESHKKPTTTSSPLTKPERHIKPVGGKTTVTKTGGSPATADSKQNPSTKQVVDGIEQKSQKDLSSASNQNKV